MAGTLLVDLSSSGGTPTSLGITGSLTSNLTAVARFGGTVRVVETCTITSCSFLNSTSEGPASGQLNDFLTGALSATGTFHFDTVKYLTANNSPQLSCLELALSLGRQLGNQWRKPADR